MAHRVNVILTEEVWAELQELPKGSRSRVVNDALKDWLERRERRAAGKRLDAIRNSLPAMNIDIVDIIRGDREGGH